MDGCKDILLDNMKSRFLTGALLGAHLACVAAFLELILVLNGFPYHQDYGLFLQFFGMHLVVGAAFGGCVGILIPLFARRRHRSQYPFLHLALAQITLGFLAVSGVRIFLLAAKGQAMDWSAVGTLLVQGGGFYCVTYLILRTGFGWRIASFFSPAASVGTLILLFVCALIGQWLPPQNAPDSLGPSTETADASLPNILLIVLDTVSAKHLGTYGNSRPTSPNIDTLAAEGVVFENAFSTAPWTLPSHASIFTGLHSPSHQTHWLHPRLHDGKSAIPPLGDYDYWTLAEELGRVGYQTCGVARKHWLTDRNGLTQGFQHYFDYSIPSAADSLYLPSLWYRVTKRFQKEGRGRKDKGGFKIIQTARDWLEAPRLRDEEKPFFLFLNLNEAHGPYLPPQKYRGLFLPEHLTPEIIAQTDLGVASERKKLLEGLRELGEHEIEVQRAFYDGAIRYQDDLIQLLVQDIRNRGQLENTLVIITADHGEEFGEQGRFGHQLSLHDNLLHVPLILRLPDILPAGTRIPSMASTVDIFPTILDVLERRQGQPLLKNLEVRAHEGFSLVPVARKEQVQARDWILAHYQNPASYLAGYPSWNTQNPMENPLSRHMRTITLLRSSTQKFLKFGDGNRAFVDLQKDPTEIAANTSSVDVEFESRAKVFELRLDALTNSFLVRRELFLGNLGRWFRQAERPSTSNKQSTTKLEETGYVGHAQATDAEGDPLRPPAILFPN